MNLDLVLDGRTMLFYSAISMPIFSCIFWRMKRSLAVKGMGFGHFAVGNAMLTLGAILLGLRGIIDFEVSFIGGNGLILAAAAQYVLAVRHFDELPSWRYESEAAIALAFGTALVARSIEDQAIRVAIVTGWMSIACVLGALSLFKNSKKLTKSRAFTIGCFFALAAITAFRAIENLMAHAGEVQLFTATPGAIALYLVGSILCLCLSMGMVAMGTERVQERLIFLSTHDAQTGARSRASFFDLASLEMHRTQRNNYTTAVLMADLDNLKRLNEADGHATGDRALMLFAESIQAILRKEDTLGRYGGGKFLIMLPNTAREDALLVAERIRKVSETIVIKKTAPAGKRQITVSIGVANTHDFGADIEKLILGVDKAMYAAKKAGKNCIRVAEAS
jgi:diguanylate cyclase (GGDEF)-like protein